ncbi:MAG: hypothetical protein U0234_04220 [Sandaracinus sp.]
MSSSDPRRRDPHRPDRAIDDDEAPGLPELDGAELDPGVETGVLLDVDDDEASALDDAPAGIEEDAELDEDPDESSALEDEAPAAVEADASLGEGEEERWTEGSEGDEQLVWQEPVPQDEASESAIDRGEEGVEEPSLGAGDALPGLPPAHVGDDDGDAEDLEVSEAGVLETSASESDELPRLPSAQVHVRFLGPSGEAVRSVAVGPEGPIAGARSLYDLSDDDRGVVSLPAEGDVSAVLATPAALWAATDAGDVLRLSPGAEPQRFARPGTADASVGALDLARVGESVLARTRGGALFRATQTGWVGPVVAKNVRRIRSALGPAPDWIALVVGSDAAPELLCTREARTFERLRAPEGQRPVEAARAGDTVAVATSEGALFVSHDAGAGYARIDTVSRVERVWVAPDGSVLAAVFHEALDRGLLVRVRTRAEGVLDVLAEVARSRLVTPGELDGDGRVHDVALDASGTLYVATGVGVFAVRDRGPGGE